MNFKAGDYVYLNEDALEEKYTPSPGVNIKMKEYAREGNRLFKIDYIAEHNGEIWYNIKGWWWIADWLIPKDQTLVPNTDTPIIKKIKAMQRKRKEAGYAF